MRRMLDFEEGAEPRQDRFGDIPSPSRSVTGLARNAADVQADSAGTARRSFKRPAAVVSLPVTHPDGSDGRNATARHAPASELRGNPDSTATIRTIRTRSGSEEQALPVVVRHRDEAETAPDETRSDEISWEVVIPRALRERRFAVALRPIEKLACGSKLYEASPLLLDDAGGEIGVREFYGPASRLGWLKHIERKLAGYAFMAQLELQHAGESTWMLVPLSGGALDDRDLLTFLRTLASHPGARLAMDSLVFEFDQKDIAERVHDVEKFAEELGRLGCNLGMRGFTATRQAEQLLKALQFVTVRLAPELIDRLAGDEGLRNSLRAISDRCARSGTVVIAPGALDADAMALLYSLGVRAVESPTTGRPRLYQPRRSRQVH